MKRQVLLEATSQSNEVRHLKKKSKNDKNNIEKFDFMKANKDNIKNIVKDDSTLVKLNDIVLNVNKIVIHAYNLIKYIAYICMKIVKRFLHLIRNL